MLCKLNPSVFAENSTEFRWSNSILLEKLLGCWLHGQCIRQKGFFKWQDRTLENYVFVEGRKETQELHLWALPNELWSCLHCHQVFYLFVFCMTFSAIPSLNLVPHRDLAVAVVDQWWHFPVLFSADCAYSSQSGLLCAALISVV